MCVVLICVILRRFFKTLKPQMKLSNMHVVECFKGAQFWTSTVVLFFLVYRKSSTFVKLFETFKNLREILIEILILYLLLNSVTGLIPLTLFISYEQDNFLLKNIGKQHAQTPKTFSNVHRKAH